MTGDRRALVAFLATCALGVFAFGVAVGKYRVFPYSILKYAHDSMVQVFSESDTILGLRPTEFLDPARYEGSGVTALDQDQAAPGLTFLMGFFGDGNEIRLIQLDGSLVGRWPVKFFDLFPDPQHVNRPTELPQSEWNVSIQGGMMLPDGSVVFNFGSLGAVKLTRCGETVWTIPRMTHHVIAPANSGDFWIPSVRYVEDVPEYPNLKTPYNEDRILKVSQDGEILKELSVLEILYKNGLDGFLFQHEVTGDLTHLNDIEELAPKLAARFAPQFEVGDLMLSLRREDLLLVVDPETLTVKWYQSGPWLGQHDPDFLENGRISVFSNDEDGTPNGSRFGGSTIMEVDPASGEVQFRYGNEPGQTMYTRNRGDHQTLGEGNGHVLITESTAGRVFEVDSEGKIVWEYVNRFDDVDAAVVSTVHRYPNDYFTVSDWTCR